MLDHISRYVNFVWNGRWKVPTELLLAGVSVKFQLVEVVSVLLSRPRSSTQLVHVHLLQFFWLHLFPNTYETILGHFGERTVLSQAAGLEMKSHSRSGFVLTTHIKC